MQTWTTVRKNTQKISSGVAHTELIINKGDLRQSIQVCAVDLDDPYTRLETVSHGNGVTRLETVRNLALEQREQGKRVVAAVNGDFFSSLGVPSGLQITNGEIITSPQTTKVALGILSPNRPFLVTNILMTATLKVQNSKLNIGAINRTRGLNFKNDLFVFNSRFGRTTKTPFGGIEVVVRPETGSSNLYPGRVVKGVVEGITESFNSEIPENCLVFSATGAKSQWLLTHLSPGTEIELVINYDQGIDHCIQVLSGNSTLAYELLKDGEVNPKIADPRHPFYNDRHPRTVIAIRENQLYLITIDGRQSGHSDGVTFVESAKLLKDLGMEDAINIDGGGSTTCLVRPLGSSELELVNSPSDGFERPVGNGLILTNVAPPGVLNELLVEPHSNTIRVLAGSTIDLSVKGVDQYLNPVIVSKDSLTWRLAGSDIGVIDSEGKFYAAKNANKGELSVRSGDVTASVNVETILKPAELKFENDKMILEPGSTVHIPIHARDHEDNPIYLSPDVLEWEIDGDIGHWIAPGLLLVAKDFGNGVVKASHNGVQGILEIQVGKRPLVLENFESTEGLSIRASNVVHNSVTFKQVSRPHPIRFGAFSGQLTYDFTGQIGTSIVIIQFMSGQGDLGRIVPGEPRNIGLWVYGDAKNHWLRLITIDASSNKRNLNFTPLGGLNWKGWRYVRAEVPQNTTYPLTILGVALVEPNDANKNSGELYFSHLRAEYVNLEEDLEGPYFSNLCPTPRSRVKNLQPKIQVQIVDDDSGVNANSIQMWLNGQLVDHEYDGANGTLTYEPPRPLSSGVQTVSVHAADNAGNPSLPLEDWVFHIDEQD